ncbi:MAG: hypothetical protein QOC97_938, partial [Chloroflexota bacterium]|nr:hypothetical protein [Chloroflexota bacterium]
MDARMTALASRMFGPGDGTSGLLVVDPAPWLAADSDPLAQVTAAFLVAVAGVAHPDRDKALAVLADPPEGPARDLAAFYRTGLDRMAAELDRVTTADPGVARRLTDATADLDAPTSTDDATEAIWRVFFPQAVGIRGDVDGHIRDLRAARTVSVIRPATDPISDPGREVLFTSNVLLTVPAETTDVGRLPYGQPLRDAIAAAVAEPQRFWFDHPIQLGVEPAGNELSYGLRGLDAAVDAEPEAGRATCLLSVSVTHDGLGPVARPYVEAELARGGGMRHLDVVVVTERDAGRLVDEVIVPALRSRLGAPAAVAAAPGLRAVVGVDGEYGRHYSFLKAVAALWHVAIDPVVRATFKIDLDQVFPQEVLLAETGRTAFGHLATPLWGATARDAEGREIDLGMLAGALVN